MKIALLSGAYKNAGDYLIEQRCKELLQANIEGCMIQEYKRNIALDDMLDEINQYDAIVLAGGPAYVEKMYPEKIALCKDLSGLKPPVFPMAMGWRGANVLPKTIQNYRYSEQTMMLFHRIEKDGFSFGCRDYYTEQVLRSNRIKKTIMTGCAAWYDLNYIEDTHIYNSGNIKRIYVSDPGSSRFYSQFLLICSFLKRRYPNAEIKVMFHRGIGSDQYTSNKAGNELKTLCDRLRRMGIPYEDISYSFEKLKNYQDCDLHIGYRVHAHLFNLSQRRRSVLIEEDSRGAGANWALGLPEIKAYDPDRQTDNKYLKGIKKCFGLNDINDSLLPELGKTLDSMEMSDFLEIEQAFERMQSCYVRMQQHLNELKNSIPG